MTDMTAVTAAKSDQINADDLLTGPRTVTIADVRVRPGTEQPVEISLEGTDKFFRPCKTVSRVLVSAWGPDAKQYVGRSLTLYRDPAVTWGGVQVGGIRVSAMSHLDKELVLALAETRKARKVHKIKPLVMERAADGWTIDRARAELTDAQTLVDLRKVWLLKAMAPFRDRLQPMLDARKADLTPNDGTLAADTPAARDDVDHGDALDGDEA